MHHIHAQLTCVTITTVPVATDLFGEDDAAKPKKTTKAKKKTSKKSQEPKDLSMFDDNAPSIFDDPLSALGTS